jgi:hypothetical protein
LLHAPCFATGEQISRGFQGGVPPWSQGAGSCPAREGEAGSLDGIEATVGRGKAKLFPLRVDFEMYQRPKIWALTVEKIPEGFLMGISLISEKLFVSNTTTLPSA